MPTVQTFKYWLTHWVSRLITQALHKILLFADLRVMEVAKHPAHLISSGGGGYGFWSIR